MTELFDKEVLTCKLEDLMTEINELLNDIAPEGKNCNDFTGGYVQQLKNSNQFVAYFGQKGTSGNRDSVKVTVQANELDLFYVMLKAKIHEMKSKNTKTVSISMAQRRLDRKASKGESDGEAW